MTASIKSRIAPTPSGYLHIGNAFNFLITALLVDLNKGSLYLRIDDIDNLRIKKKAVEDIFVQLEWLGIEYDSGPSGPEELFSKHSQQLRIDYYFYTIETLKKNNEIFACECSRADIRRLSSKNHYLGACRYKNIDLETKNTTWRINVPHGNLVQYNTIFNSKIDINVAEKIGDFVLKRKDGKPSYQIVSLVEDLEHEINLIVRGQDLIPSTAAQLFLAKSINESKFLDSKFVHHKLLKNNLGEKLSKSYGDLSLKEIKKKIQTPTFIFRETAKHLNLQYKEIFTFDHLKESFKNSINQKKSCLNFE